MYQRMRQHIEAEHNMRYQYMCSHCKVGNGLERSMIAHAIEAHRGKPGLAVQQFERVPNELLDSYNWDLGQNIEPISSTPTDTAGAETTIDPIATAEQPLEMIELIVSSDEESDEQQCQMVPSSIDGQVRDLRGCCLNSS